MPSKQTRLMQGQGHGVTRRLLMLGSACAALAGCSTATETSLAPSSLAGPQPDAPAATTLSGGVVKAALLLPFGKGGEAGKLAASLKQAAELALFDVNGTNVALIPKDTGGTAQGAAAAAKEAIAAGAELLIGPLFAAEVQGVAPLAQASNVPVLAFSSDRTVAGNGVYLLSFLAGDEIGRVVTYAAAAGRRSFAALVPQTAYGTVSEKAFRATVPAAGGQVALIERYSADANALAAPLGRLRAAIEAAKTSGAPIDALLLPGGQDVLPIIAPMLASAGIDGRTVKLLGTGGWDYPEAAKEAGLAGGWYAAPDPAARTDFAARYAKTYGAAPLRLASLGYDAVTLALALAANPAGQRFTAASLTRSSGFAGVDGLFRLRPDGSCERALAILEVAPSGARVVDAPPTVFRIAQF